MLIEKLTIACGLPGYEGEVRDIIIDALKGHVDSLRTDRMGNLIAVKNACAPGRPIVLNAHMDEAGLCVKSIDADGYLKFAAWGVDPRVIYAKTVSVGKNKIPGVVGAAPGALLTPEQLKTAVPLDKLYIDIGAGNRDEAGKVCAVGDFAAFTGEYREFGAHKIKAKALDDRAGCAALIEILQSNTKRKLTGVFCAQEEAGLRGSVAAAYQIDADLVINLEGTVCADTEGTPSHRQVTRQGDGPAVSLADRSSVYLRPYIDAITACAERAGIPYQYRGSGAGGTDAASYHQAKTGVPVIGLAVPCRYIHSPVSVMDIRDYRHLIALIKEYIQ